MTAAGLTPSSVPPLLYSDIPGAKLIRRGKVRDIYDAGENILIVATDRISAFDVILPTGIPGKGEVLTQISKFWFKKAESLVAHHFVSTEVSDFPTVYRAFDPMLSRRSMLVRRANPLPIECVVRGYLAGSGWTDYRKSGGICGIPLPRGLKESQELDRPVFTPATKAESGHDLNISFDEACDVVGNREVVERTRDISLRIYAMACEVAKGGGVIIADTKFEFGIRNGELILIDEALTPDSSRFWPRNEYEPGRPQRSFDKQFVRDYLNTLKWDKTPPGPSLPPDIVQKTAQKYAEAFRLLTSG